MEWIGAIIGALVDYYQGRKRRKAETQRYDAHQARLNQVGPLAQVGVPAAFGNPHAVGGSGEDIRNIGRALERRNSRKDQDEVDKFNSINRKLDTDRRAWENVLLKEQIRSQQIQNDLNKNPQGSFNNPEVGLHWWKLKTKDGKELKLVTTKEELAESMEGSSAQKVMYMFNINYGTYKQLSEMFK